MTEERTQYTVQRYAELESQIADSAPDELTQLRAENIRLRNELDKQVNAWGGYVDAHAGNYSRMNARIAELEAALHDTTTQLATATETIARLEQEVKGYRLSAAVMEGAYVTSDDAATELKATVARLEADNKRLRHLDAMPVDAMRRYHLFTHYDVHAANDAGYTTQQFDEDDIAIGAWLDSLDGDA